MAMFSEKPRYAALEQDDVSQVGTRSTPPKSSYPKRLSTVLLTPWILCLSLVISNVYLWIKFKPIAPEHPIFSPATSAIRFQNIVGTSGVLGDNSPYQGPRTEENDRLWEDLYNCKFGISRIPMSDAAMLVNRTVPIPNDPGYYAITLDVFHQLHCLNLIRKRVWSKDDFETMQHGPLNTIHMDHCVDSLRQSLMCSSDITPMPYAWYTQYSASLPATGMMRTCRDFEAIRQWGKERQSYLFETDIYVEDPLGNVIRE